MQSSRSLPTNLIVGGSGIPLPALQKTVEKTKILESRSDLLPTPSMIPISSCKAFVPLKLKVRRLLTLLMRVKSRKQNFL